MTDDNNNKSSVGFSVDASDDGHNPPPRRASKRSSLRSSFFRLRSMSFRRSGGDRGADINTLRGTNGPDFEGYATINRADGVLLCNCFGGYKKDKKEKILLIKGPYLFVFVKESDPTPKYAVELAHMKAVMKHASGGVQHMTIETSLGDVEWDLTFQQQQIAKQFADAFRQQAAVGEAEEVQKRLGHDNLHKKRSSVKYAETVATKKTGEVPKKKENPTLEELNREAGFMTGM